ncbi:MAG: AbrB/MazE/SpoVT family DNA-binding domain-containing protein [Clostridia bacterium]|nr:AbrB/MazE/SpoVT family DNA-binding domain-containing protein [Clostridia bacterium]
MKATGIVRRIDDLGRVVIPKEIRRTMRIREGDPLEIYTAADGEVIFKKYSPIGEMSQTAIQFADALSKHTELPVIITDRDHCIAAAGIAKREAIDHRISPALEETMEARRSFVSSSEGKSLAALEGLERQVAVAYPILCAGDVLGAVLLLSDEEGRHPSETDIKLTAITANFLAKQMEE